MELIWHTHTIDEPFCVLDQALTDASALYIEGHAKTIAYIKEHLPQVQVEKSLRVMGLHPTKILINHPYEFNKDHPAALQDGVNELWNTYHVPIHLYIVVPYQRIWDALYNPERQNDLYSTHNDLLWECSARLDNLNRLFKNRLDQLLLDVMPLQQNKFHVKRLPPKVRTGPPQPEEK